MFDNQILNILNICPCVCDVILSRVSGMDRLSKSAECIRDTSEQRGLTGGLPRLVYPEPRMLRDHRDSYRQCVLSNPSGSASGVETGTCGRTDIPGHTKRMFRYISPGQHSVSKQFANVPQHSCTRDRKFGKTFANVSILNAPLFTHSLIQGTHPK